MITINLLLGKYTDVQNIINHNFHVHEQIHNQWYKLQVNKLINKFKYTILFAAELKTPFFAHWLKSAKINEHKIYQDDETWKFFKKNRILGTKKKYNFQIRMQMR